MNGGLSSQGPRDRQGNKTRLDVPSPATSKSPIPNGEREEESCHNVDMGFKEILSHCSPQFESSPATLATSDELEE